MTPHEGPSERLPDPVPGCEPSRPSSRDRSHHLGLAPGMGVPIYSFLVARGCRRVERLEDSPSGLWRTLGKRVGCKPSGVRIPHPPPPDPGTTSGSGVFVACGAAGVPGAFGPGRPLEKPHASLRLGVVDLDARPCPPNPPTPSTPTVPARRVVRRVVSWPGPAMALPIGAAADFRWGRPVVMCCASLQLRARGENVYAGGRSSA